MPAEEQAEVWREFLEPDLSAAVLFARCRRCGRPVSRLFYDEPPRNDADGTAIGRSTVSPDRWLTGAQPEAVMAASRWVAVFRRSCECEPPSALPDPATLRAEIRRACLAGLDRYGLEAPVEIRV